MSKYETNISFHLYKLCIVRVWLDGASKSAFDVDAPLTGEEDEGVEKSGDAKENSTDVEELLQPEHEQPHVPDQTVDQKPRT